MFTINHLQRGAHRPTSRPPIWVKVEGHPPRHRPVSPAGCESSGTDAITGGNTFRRGKAAPGRPGQAGLIKDLEFLAGVAVDREEARALDLARQVASVTAWADPGAPSSSR